MDGLKGFTGGKKTGETDCTGYGLMEGKYHQIRRSCKGKCRGRRRAKGRGGVCTVGREGKNEPLLRGSFGVLPFRYGK